MVSGNAEGPISLAAGPALLFASQLAGLPSIRIGAVALLVAALWASVFTSLEQLGNPYQNVSTERAAWTRRLDQSVAEMSAVAASGKSVEYLFFVGRIGSFVPRNQKVTIALARILQTAGISFAILGTEETCTGDPARRIGHEYLAQRLAAKTVEKLNF